MIEGPGFKSGHNFTETSLLDLIVTVGRSLVNASQYQSDNISNARARGLEFGIRGGRRIELGRPIDIRARVTYTLLDSEILAEVYLELIGGRQAQLGLGETDQVPAGQLDPAGDRGAAPVVQAEQGQRGAALARAGLADDAEGAPARHREAHPVDRPQRPGRRCEPHSQVVFPDRRVGVLIVGGAGPGHPPYRLVHKGPPSTPRPHHRVCPMRATVVAVKIPARHRAACGDPTPDEVLN